MQNKITNWKAKNKNITSQKHIHKHKIQHSAGRAINKKLHRQLKWRHFRVGVKGAHATCITYVYHYNPAKAFKWGSQRLHLAYVDYNWAWVDVGDQMGSQGEYTWARNGHCNKWYQTSLMGMWYYHKAEFSFPPRRILTSTDTISEFIYQEVPSSTIC